MERKNWRPHLLLILFNILILLSVWLSYADSHGLLSTSAVTDGTFSNIMIVIVYYLSCFLALVPYGCGVLILSIVRYFNARKNAQGGPQPKLRYMIAALPALVFTLAAKYLFLLGLAAQILYPDNFHI